MIPRTLTVMCSSRRSPVDQGYLVSDGMGGRFFEVDAGNAIVWQYINPVNQFGHLAQGSTPENDQVFRCSFYPADFAGFAGHTIVPGDEVESQPTEPSLCDITWINGAEILQEPLAYPDPATDRLFVDHMPHGTVPMRWLDPLGRMGRLVTLQDAMPVGIDISPLAPGVFLSNCSIGTASCSVRWVP